jgi:hypothetical protein
MLRERGRPRYRADEADLSSEGQSEIGGGIDDNDPPTKACEPPLTRVPRGRPAKQRMPKGEMGRKAGYNYGGLPDIPNKRLHGALSVKDWATTVRHAARLTPRIAHIRRVVVNECLFLRRRSLLLCSCVFPRYILH